MAILTMRLMLSATVLLGGGARAAASSEELGTRASIHHQPHLLPPSLPPSHRHLVFTPSPQSLSPSSGDEVKLLDGVLPLVGESHPSGIGVVAANVSPSVAAVGVPASVHAHPGHGRGAALVVVARRRVGVHLDHVVSVHGRRDADVLLRLGLLVVAEPTHGGHHPGSTSPVTTSHYQPHGHQLVLQTVRRHQEPLVGPGTTHWVVFSTTTEPYRSI